MGEASELEVEEAREADCTRLAVRGELDTFNADVLRERLQALRDEKSNVRLDLSSLEFIDSRGARVIIDAMNDAQADHWRVALEPEVTPQVRRLFALLKASGVEFDF